MSTMPPEPITFIPGAGACIATRKVIEERGRLQWMYRSDPIEPPDSGWRCFSEIDTQEYIDDPSNSVVIDYNTLCAIEPAAIIIYPLPVGADVEINRHEDGRITVHDMLEEGRDITAELAARP